MKQKIDEGLLSDLEPADVDNPDHRADSGLYHGRYVVRDDAIPGLIVRVYESGSFGLYLDYRVKGGAEKGKRVVYHLCSSDINTFRNMTQTMQRNAVKIWRADAAKAAALVAAGRDPAQDRRDAKEAARLQSSQRKLDLAAKRARAAVERESATNTINVLAEFEISAKRTRYIGAYAKAIQKRKTGSDTLKMLVNAWTDLGDIPVRSITTEKIQVIVDRWSEAGELQPASIDRYVTTLKAFLNWCIEKELLTLNPCNKKIKKQSGAHDYEAPYRALSAEEVKKLFNTCDTSADIDEFFRVLVKLAVFTGLRRGELLQIQWEDVKGAIISVRRGLTKTDKSRTVKLSNEALRILSAWQCRDGVHRARGNVFEGELRQLTNQVKRLWPLATGRAGIDAGFHSLRHTFAATLARNGAPIHRISQLMGHSSLDMTMRYAREIPEHLGEVDLLDSVFTR